MGSRMLSRDCWRGLKRVPCCVLSEVHCRNRPLLNLRATMYGRREEGKMYCRVYKERKRQIGKEGHADYLGSLLSYQPS